MNEELNLDNLKHVWQQQRAEKNYSTKEIFKILKRKSITSVRWVFIISMIEITLAVILYVGMFARVDIAEYHQNLLQSYGKWAFAYEFLTFVIYGVTFLFIYQFFKSYRKIQVNSSVKELSLDIIRFRRVVNNFIYFNLIMMAIIFFIVLIPVINNNPALQQLDWMSATGLGIIAGIFFVLAFMIGLMWLYYYVLYGTFQRRLKRNLRDLDAIEEN